MAAVRAVMAGMQPAAADQLAVVGTGHQRVAGFRVVVEKGLGGGQRLERLLQRIAHHAGGLAQAVQRSRIGGLQATDGVSHEGSRS